jgi:hypothetical protein
VHLCRRNFRLLCAIAAAPCAVVVAGYAAQIVAGQAARIQRHSSSSQLVIFFLIDLPLTVVAFAYLHAALTSAAVDIYLGLPITLRAAAFRVLPRYWRFLWLTVLQTLIVLGIPCVGAIVVLIPLAILGAIFAGSASPAALGGTMAVLTFVAFMGLAIWLLSRVALAVAVCWVEDKSAWASIKRASALSKGARGRVAMAYVFFYAIFGIVLMLRLSVVAIVASSARHAGHHFAGTPFVLTKIFEVLYSFASEMLLTPLASAALAILYIDQRVRKEGFDIDWMMYQTGLHVPQASPLHRAAQAVSDDSSMPLAEPATVKEP